MASAEETLNKSGGRMMTNETPNTEQSHVAVDCQRFVMRAEIRAIRGPTDEYESYLVLQCGGKTWPYIHIPETLPDDVLEMALEKLNA